MGKNKFFLHINMWVSLFVLLAYFLDYLNTSFGFIYFIIGLFLLIVLLQLINKTLKYFHYSFWTFSVILIMYLSRSIYSCCMNGVMGKTFAFYFFSLLMMLFVMVTLFTPAFYPIIKWWNFSNSVIKGTFTRAVSSEEKSHIRITDIRRNSCCVLAFDDLNIGEKILIESFPSKLGAGILGEIVTKRKYSLGRGYYYGLKLLLDNDYAKKRYFELKQMV